MASLPTRLPDNAAGPYYVDDTCIDCDTCRCISGEHFRRNEERGYSYVNRQPCGAGELRVVAEAMDCCPVGAIKVADEDQG